MIEPKTLRQRLRGHVATMRELADIDAASSDRLEQGMAIARKSDASLIESTLDAYKLEDDPPEDLLGQEPEGKVWEDLGKQLDG